MPQSFKHRWRTRKWRPFYPDDVTKLIRKQDECWIWIGTVHKLGYPIYKGWQYARYVVMQLALGRALKPCERFRHGGPVCGNRLCVRPTHQRMHLVRPKQAA